MVVRTCVEPRTVLLFMLTLLSFIEEGVVFWLFPSVAEVAVVTSRAAFAIV